MLAYRQLQHLNDLSHTERGRDDMGVISSRNDIARAV
jgi:hypothetical protein